MLNHPPRYQRGLTLWGWLYVLATLGLMLLVGIKCVPVYMNNYEIRSTLVWASNQPELHDASVHEIQSRIQRRFDAGYVEEINARDIHVKRIKDGRVLDVKYQVRRPLFFNIDLLFNFHETATLSAR